MKPIRILVVAIPLSIAVGLLVGAGSTQSPAKDVLGGNRFDGQYARLEAHGLYWTASDNDSGSAPYYNFGQNGQALHRQPQGAKQMAISVRCLRP